MFWLMRYGIFWLLFNSVRLFDEQFLPNCEPVDGRHPAPPPPPGYVYPTNAQWEKKFSDFHEKSIRNSKPLIFKMFLQYQDVVFFGFFNSVRKNISDFSEKYTDYNFGLRI